MTPHHDKLAELIRLTYTERKAFIQDAVIRGSYDSLVSAVENELLRKVAALLAADGQAGGEAVAQAVGAGQR